MRTVTTRSATAPGSFVPEVVGPTYTAIQDYINTRVNASIAAPINPAVAIEIWSTRDHDTPTYTRNPDCWVVDADLSGCAVWTSSGNPNKKTCTLITPSCGAVAAHFPLNNGNTVRFVTPGEQVVTRTVVQWVNHPNWPAQNSFDLRIVKFDQPVTGCQPLFLLPDDWRDYIPRQGHQLLVLFMNQFERAGIGMVNTIGGPFGNLGFSTILIPNTYSNYANLNQFYYSPTFGDSSDPCIMLYQGQPILMTVWRWGGPTAGGYSMTEDSAWIDQTCQALAGETPNRVSFVL